MLQSGFLALERGVLCECRAVYHSSSLQPPQEVCKSSFSRVGVGPAQLYMFLTASLPSFCNILFPSHRNCLHLVGLKLSKTKYVSVSVRTAPMSASSTIFAWGLCFAGFKWCFLQNSSDQYWDFAGDFHSSFNHMGNRFFQSVLTCVGQKGICCTQMPKRV